MNKIYSTFALLLLAGYFSVSWGQLTNKSVTIGAVNRTYKQYLPVAFDPQTEQVSLVVILHGIGGSSSDMVSTGFNYIADTARVIAIYPQGVLNAYGQTSWNNGTLLASSVDDIGFMHAILDSMILNYNVDPARVYFTGFSMGSIMTHHLACAMNNRIAAIGCMAGTMPSSDIQNCSPTYATPVIHLHGTADGTVPYSGSALPSLSLVAETINFWRNVHGCDATADSTQLPNTAADNITIDRFVYDNCTPLTSVELWRFNGADHIYLYEPLNDITEMMEVWLFLRQWTHSSPAPAGINTSNIIQLTIAPNPSNGVYSIKSNSAIDYSIENLNGQTVHSGTLVNGITSIDLTDQTSGFYFLKAGNSTRKMIRI